MINIKIFTNLNGIEENKKIKNMIKRSMENNVFCLAPWTHLYVDPNGDCMPCCISGRNEETNFGNIYNLSVDKIEKFKLKMLEGKKIESCESCYKQQQTNDGKSYRDSFYYNFKHILNELNYKNIFKFQEILYLDFRFSNKCNFACRTCSANYSSRWEKAIKIENENKIDYSDFLKKIKDLILNDTLKHIYFAGGEPLIMDEQWEILNFIIDNNKQDNFELIYNTNLSVIKYKNNIFVEKIKKIKKHRVLVSCDGLYEAGEYIRYGFKHKKFIENIKILIDNDINYQITMVLSILNILNLKDFILQLIELDILKDNLTLNIPKEDNHHNPYIVSDDIKKIFISDIDFLVNNDKVKNKHVNLTRSLKLLKKDFEINCNFNKNKIIEFFKYSNYIDKTFNTSLKKSLPLLYNKIIEMNIDDIS